MCRRHTLHRRAEGGRSGGWNRLPLSADAAEARTMRLDGGERESGGHRPRLPGLTEFGGNAPSLGVAHRPIRVCSSPFSLCCAPRSTGRGAEHCRDGPLSPVRACTHLEFRGEGASALRPQAVSLRGDGQTAFGVLADCGGCPVEPARRPSRPSLPHRGYPAVRRDAGPGMANSVKHPAGDRSRCTQRQLRSANADTPGQTIGTMTRGNMRGSGGPPPAVVSGRRASRETASGASADGLESGQGIGRPTCGQDRPMCLIDRPMVGQPFLRPVGGGKNHPKMNRMTPMMMS